MSDPIKCQAHWTKPHLTKVKRNMNHILYEWVNEGSELPSEVRQRVNDLINAINQMEATE